jgi:hypothetical protein
MTKENLAPPRRNLFDMRDFYLKDLTLIGCPAWDEPVFLNQYLP